eukprot:2511161-Alexandrium_andersonii.AAC.1
MPPPCKESPLNARGQPWSTRGPFSGNPPKTFPEHAHDTGEDGSTPANISGSHRTEDSHGIARNLP